MFLLYDYNHARRLRLENILRHLEPPRSPNGHFKPLLGPGGGFASETTAWRFQKQNGRYIFFLEAKRLQIYNGKATHP